jgi:SAM-dependent methyltransferase
MRTPDLPVVSSRRTTEIYPCDRPPPYRTVRVKPALRRLLVEPFEEPLARLLEEEVTACCRTVLDLGCGFDSPLRRFASRLEHSVGVDMFAPYLAQSRDSRIHSEYRQGSALEAVAMFGERSFDCAMAIDLIEHLEKPDGERLLDVLERVARRRAIVFTPNGFVPQESYDGNPYQTHRSGWTPDEMRSRGYRLYGVHGWKPLRAERGEPRWRPRRFWATLALRTQPLVEHRPDIAYHLLCVKDLS